MKKYHILFILFALIGLKVLAQESIPAPDFRLKNINGDSVSLSDFKGKIVYLDFWATWCYPCMSEIPHLKKLQNQFKENENIVFIGISIDKDTLKWKKVVNSKKLQGIQLNSSGEEYSIIRKNYELTTIPRFILIGKDGEIIDMNAPYPNEPALVEKLKELSGN